MESLVVVYDAQTDQTIELISNHFYPAANNIGEPYKALWDIEIFFKEIKQLLKIIPMHRDWEPPRMQC